MRSLLASCLGLLVAGCAVYPNSSPPPTAAGNQATARDRASSPTETMSGAAAALLAPGRAEVQAGAYLQAGATLERALRIEPGQALLWLELAEIRLLEGRAGQAVEMARKARALAAGEPSVLDAATALIERAGESEGDRN